MHKNIPLVVGLTILFLGTCITPAVAIDTVKKQSIPTSNGNILYVGGYGPNNYSKIQDGIDAANGGDIVFVYAYSSPYYENIEISKEITVMGENKETTIIDGNGNDDVVYIGLAGAGAKLTGFTIQNGSDGINDAGISVGGIDNIIVNNIIKDNKNHGIQIWDQGNTISNNVIKNNKKFGIHIYYYRTSNTKVVDNIFEQHDSIYIMDGDSCDTHKIINNTANGKPIRCYKNKNNMIVPSDTSQVILINCNNCTIQNIDSSALDIGILIIGNSSNNHVYDNTILDNTYAGVMIESNIGFNNNISSNMITDNYFGVLIIDSESNTVYGNTIYGNEFGIWLTPRLIPKSTSTTQNYQPSFMGYNNICNNNITNNKCGIFLSHCSHNNVYQNNVTKNRCGIEIYANHGYGENNKIYLNNILNNFNGIIINGFNGGAHSNIIYQNNIMYNLDGIWIGGTQDGPIDNKVYQNNFIKNMRNGRDWSNNLWDDGSKGNYWDDYKGKDIDGNGIGDSPYRVRPYYKGNKDRYPLMEPYEDVPDVTIKSENKSKNQSNILSMV